MIDWKKFRKTMHTLTALDLAKIAVKERHDKPTFWYLTGAISNALGQESQDAKRLFELAHTIIGDQTQAYHDAVKLCRKIAGELTD